MIAEMKRELAMRHAVYDKRVGSGKMKGEERDRKIAITKEIIKTLESLHKNAGVQKDLFNTPQHYEKPENPPGY